MNLTNTIDILQSKDLTKSFFEENYIDKNKPAIIKGLLNNTQASTWTLDKLDNRLGNYAIKVFNVKETKRTSFFIPSQEIKMKEMLDLIRTKSSSDYRMFVNPILKKDKKLGSELPSPAFFKGWLQLPNLLFLGGKDCVVPLHYDFMKDDGLLTQFFGRKDVILVPNSQSRLLYQLPCNTTSFVNLFEPDYERYPALHQVSGIKTTLHHGDTLYIPAGYWHQLKYIDASMSVAYRKWNINVFTTLITAIKHGTFMPFDKLMSFLFRDKWLYYKVGTAKKRAEEDLG